MKIFNPINKSSIVNIPKDTLNFIDGILQKTANFAAYLNLGGKHIWGGKGVFLKTPVYLVNEKEMNKYISQNYKEKFDEKEFKEFEKEKRGENVATDILGVYLRNRQGNPEIIICPEKILKHAHAIDVFDRSFTYLVAKVVIHEFMHAQFDAYNQNANCEHNRFFTWMEESLANKYTLHIVDNMVRKHNYPKDFLTFVEYFIKGQPFQYTLGYYLYSSGIGGKLGIKWAKRKVFLCSKNNCKVQDINTWMDYVLNNYRNFNKNDFSKLYTNLFSTSCFLPIRKFLILHS